ncbi:Mitochondrial ATPase complex subunit atp10, partial [Sticta canariensis]|nr:Mitochondrial ATPase complex subunit atp10 [Sticta canariensis]
VEVNIEERIMRAWFVRMSVGALQRARPASEWGLHFMVRRGVTAHVREQLGIFNKVVGYVYLVDDECRIRWAGCGNATEEERVSLAKLARRLVEGGVKKGGENEGVARDNGKEKLERAALGAGG